MNRNGVRERYFSLIERLFKNDSIARVVYILSFDVSTSAIVKAKLGLIALVLIPSERSDPGGYCMNQSGSNCNLKGMHTPLVALT